MAGQGQGHTDGHGAVVGFRCERYHTTWQSQAGCVAYQAKDPLACAKCPHSLGAAPRKGWRATYNPERKAKAVAVAKERSEAMSKRRVCVDCGRELTLAARGQCSVCYRAWRKQEHTDGHGRAPTNTDGKAGTDGHGAEVVTLTFEARDAELYRWLAERATADRRALKDQVLYLLDGLKGAACGG